MSVIFQFHKGTIKTFCGRGPLEEPILFQFHKGTIKTIHRMRIILQVLSYFNSIKVRLKL